MQSTLEQTHAAYRQTQARENLQQHQRDAGARDETLAAVLGLRLTSEPNIRQLHSTLDQLSSRSSCVDYSANSSDQPRVQEHDYERWH